MNEMMKFRRSSRMYDIKESESLLLELVTSEPTIIQCFRIIESTCLSQGIFCRIDGEEPSDRFQRFVDEKYSSFCKCAIRAAFTYGFVPWRVRKLPRGDEVPEVLPPGTFSWHTEAGDSDREVGYRPQRKRTSRPDENSTTAVVYRVMCSIPGVSEEDVHITVFQPPPLDISVNSTIYATVPSPLAHILGDYKNLREAQQRRSHADSWFVIFSLP